MLIWSKWAEVSNCCVKLDKGGELWPVPWLETSWQDIGDCIHLSATILMIIYLKMPTIPLSAVSHQWSLRKVRCKLVPNMNTASPHHAKILGGSGLDSPKNLSKSPHTLCQVAKTRKSKKNIRVIRVCSMCRSVISQIKHTKTLYVPCLKHFRCSESAT